jgi:hypothetical protein
LADGIDPNVQDATLVVAILDWVLAEVVRLTHSVTADEASAIVNALVTRQVPIVQEFDGFLKVMNPRLGASDFVMVLLYHRGQSGATLQELKGWVRPKMRSNLARTVEALVSARDLAHFDGALYRITRLGQQYVEREGILSAK